MQTEVEGISDMQRIHRTIITSAAVLAFVGITAQPADAQWHATSFGVVEYDTNETLLLLGGVNFGPGGAGIRPVFNVLGYRLNYETAANVGGSVGLWSFRPSAGLRGGFEGGAWQALVGYALTSADETVPAGVVVPDVGTEDGVVLSGSLDWWGLGPVAAQALASYNIASEGLWTRGRLTTPIAHMATGGQVRLGGEVALLSQPGFRSVQPGGLLQWQSAGGTTFGLGVGVKLNDEIDNATYFRAEVGLPLLR
jgi:hypothetical protein